MSLRDDFEEGYNNAQLGCNIVFLCINGLNHIAWLMYALITMIPCLLAGIVWCLSIIGARFSKIIFENSIFPVKYSYRRWQGVSVKLNYKKAPIANLIWAVTFGWILALMYVLLGLIFCCSLVLIPSGLQFFKVAKNSILPFGAEFV